jgi:hypothetical protein
MSTVQESALKAYIRESYVPVITRKGAAKVRLREILYIETELRVIVIYTANREYRFYGKLDDILQYLDGRFYRCHKSCVINLEKIVQMEDGVFFFPEGVTLRVGQNNYRLTKNHYIKYLKQNAKTWQNAGDDS